MGHPQPVTQVYFEIMTASGIVKIHNIETSITRNEYGIFLDSLLKNLGKKLIYGNQDKKIFQAILQGIIQKNIINMYAPYIHI